MERGRLNKVALLLDFPETFPPFVFFSPFLLPSRTTATTDDNNKTNIYHIERFGVFFFAAAVILLSENHLFYRRFGGVVDVKRAWMSFI